MKRNFFVRIMIACFLTSGLLIPLLSICESLDTQTYSEIEVITKMGDEAVINWTTKVVKVKGNGFGPESIKELGRRKILAKRAAEIDAYRNLLEAVKGVQVTSYTTVESMMLSSDTVRARAEGMIKGMQVIEVTYSNDGGCDVTVEINIDENGDFLLAALNTGEVNIRDNYPKFNWIAQRNELTNIKNRCASLSAELERKDKKLNFSDQKMAALEMQLKDESLKLAQLQNKRDSVIDSNYTGILVDARGLDLKPALAPSILNEKTEKMYGIGSLPTRLNRGTNSSYLRGDVEWVKNNKNDKIGVNPLVVKCIKTVNSSDIMISNDDVQKLAWMNELLEEEKVAILI